MELLTLAPRSALFGSGLVPSKEARDGSPPSAVQWERGAHTGNCIAV
jgi:hypothetical protein